MKRIIPVLFTALLTLSVSAHAGPPKAWSFLWVIDNSGSMQSQRAQLAKRAPDLIKRLQSQGIRDFRMAVTTTDAISDGCKLVAAPNGTKAVDSKMADPGMELAAVVNAVMDSASSFWEQGLECAHQAIEKEGGSFLKDGDPLAIVYVTDEDDYSCEKDCFGVEPEHNPNWKAYPLERYLLGFSELRAKRNIAVSVFPIVGILEGNCAVSSYGIRYAKIRSQVGGLTGSVCPVEFEKSLFTVADYLTSTDSPTGPAVLVDPVVLPAAKEEVPFVADLNPFVSGSGQLSFTLLGGPSWLVMDAAGTVSGIPKLSNVGMNTFQVRVCNQQGQCVTFSVHLAVHKVNHPPLWVANPIPLGHVKANSMATWDLGKFVTDPDADLLQCKATSLPSWLTFRGCILMGTPREADVGKFTVELMATDSNGLTSRTTAVGTVTAR